MSRARAYARAEEAVPAANDKPATTKGVSGGALKSVASIWQDIRTKYLSRCPRVEDAQWTVMENGAMRLTARLNGQEYKATFSAKSPNGMLAIERGGTKMAQEDLRQFVENLFLPRYLEQTSV